MDASTAQLFVVVALLGINNVVFRIPGWERYRVVFWGIQLMNLAAVIYLLAIGIPGFSDISNAINWVIGLLFIIVAAQQAAQKVHQPASACRACRRRRGRGPYLF